MSDEDGRAIAEHATFIEKALETLLGLDPDTRIDRKKRLDAMGLDSILAMDLLATLEKRYGKLPDTALQDNASVEKLAAFLHARSKSA